MSETAARVSARAGTKGASEWGSSPSARHKGIVLLPRKEEHSLLRTTTKQNRPANLK